MTVDFGNGKSGYTIQDLDALFEQMLSVERSIDIDRIKELEHNREFWKKRNRENGVKKRGKIKSSE